MELFKQFDQGSTLIAHVANCTTDLEHSNASGDSPCISTICPACFLGVAGSNHSWGNFLPASLIFGHGYPPYCRRFSIIDDESIVLPYLMFGSWILTEGSAESRRPITVSDEIELLLWSSFFAPSKPIVDSDNCAMRPKRKRNDHESPSMLRALRQLLLFSDSFYCLNSLYKVTIQNTP
jgi:hypothetical protein